MICTVKAHKKHFLINFRKLRSKTEGLRERTYCKQKQK